jgi:glycerol-1-phosphate dehydrogenase [NAD(P)+]
MELSKLLGTRFACDCGRVHEVPVRTFAYESGVIELLPDILRGCLGPARLRRAAIVADVRTWQVCGEEAHAALERAGWEAVGIVIPDSEHAGPVCDDVTRDVLVRHLRDVHPEVVLAVGSGVINDLCKWASFDLGLPYVVVATAASMNGYAAANVAAKVAGVKVLVEARPPLAVIAEPAVIEQAPREMTAAGFGDTIAKYQSNADWVMNHLLLDEYYCEFCAGIIGGLEPLYLDRPEDIAGGESDAVKGLFEALFWTGLAMTLVGTSAPASGGEHLLSHTLDMMAAARGESHDLHGRQVGLGTVFSAALYERILAIESPAFVDAPSAIDEGFWAVPSLVAAVTRQYAEKKPSLEAVRQRIRKPQVWDRFRARVAAEIRRPATVHGWLKRAGGATSLRDIGCSRDRGRSAVVHMHEIRRRFTVVDLAWLVGVLPDAADALIDEWLTGDK